MALIVCPECGKKNSSYVENCIECGFPIKEYMKQNGLTDINKEFICTKCGHGYAGYGDDSDPIYLKCRFCNGKVMQIDKTGEEVLFIICKDKNYLENFTKKYIGDTFSEEAYNHRLQMIKKENEASRRKRATNQQPTQPSTSQVTCPYCKSTNCKKISNGRRWLSTGLFGLSSKKIGKQWHCNSCGSDF